MVTLTLSEIFKQTRMLSLDKFKKETEQLLLDTKEYGIGDIKLRSKVKIGDSDLVTFVQDGSANASRDMTLKYKRVAVLNFANPHVPGGGVIVGAGAQEENLCRCSNLYESISMEGLDFYKTNYLCNNSVYTDSIIYSPKTLFFRDDSTYEFVDPVHIDVITCASPSCNFKRDHIAYQTYVKRIRNIIQSAIDNDVECLVLGSWGCGVFGQSPEIMAAAFVDVLNIYRGVFKEVVFAIRPTSVWQKNNNFDIFARVFSRDYEGKLVINNIV